MKKGLIISIGLIGLGLFFECLHFVTDIQFFEFKFWLLGIISIAIGIAGVLRYAIVPTLENRAEKLGKFKRKQFNKNKNSN